jgi:hypothetical protein
VTPDAAPAMSAATATSLATAVSPSSPSVPKFAARLLARLYTVTERSSSVPMYFAAPWFQYRSCASVTPWEPRYRSERIACVATASRIVFSIISSRAAELVVGVASLSTAVST